MPISPYLFYVPRPNSNGNSHSDVTGIYQRKNPRKK